MTLDELRQQRIGLLLCGGGAKGAYQIGCWKALREAGLDRFAAIAGSSVGAMNAVLVGSGRYEKGDETWRRIRPRDVIGVTTAGAWSLPLWMVAAIGSEFSPLKLTRFADTTAHECRVRRRAYPLACAAAAAALLWLARAWVPGAVRVSVEILSIFCAAAGLLSLLHRQLRPIFLRPVLTSNAALARTLDRAWSDDDLERLRRANTPVHGVVSSFVPHVPGSHLWGRTLLDGSAVPGFFPAGGIPGRWALDGSWTDNAPAGPLLFGGGPALDILIVVYLKKRFRHRPRHNSLWRVLALPVSDRLADAKQTDSLWSWAQRRWRIYVQSGLATVDHVCAPPHEKQPMIIPVAPSRRVGNFFTGTLWFSPERAAELIDLGYRDMQEALARLTDGEVAYPAPAVRPRGSIRDILAAALGQVQS
jgi:predicted acylesterase/phospholipase RssA